MMGKERNVTSSSFFDSDGRLKCNRGRRICFPAIILQIESYLHKRRWEKGLPFRLFLFHHEGEVTIEKGEAVRFI